MTVAVKTFHGNFSRGTESVDCKMNLWLKDHPNIDILEFRYQQARYGDHSICILYKEA